MYICSRYFYIFVHITNDAPCIALRCGAKSPEMAPHKFQSYGGTLGCKDMFKRGYRKRGYGKWRGLLKFIVYFFTFAVKRVPGNNMPFWFSKIGSIFSKEVRSSSHLFWLAKRTHKVHTKSFNELFLRIESVNYVLKNKRFICILLPIVCISICHRKSQHQH